MIDKDEHDLLAEKLVRVWGHDPARLAIEIAYHLRKERAEGALRAREEAST